MTIKCKYSDIKAIFEWSEKYADDEARQLIGTHHITAPNEEIAEGYFEDYVARVR